MLANLRSKKAFTIIELIVVIAVLGILVMLATPRYFDYIEKTKLTHIQNDTSVTEKLVAVHMFENDGKLGEFDKKVDINSTDLIYNKRGLITEEERSEVIGQGGYFYDVSDIIESKLKGVFASKLTGDVFYIDESKDFGNGTITLTLSNEYADQSTIEEIVDIPNLHDIENIEVNTGDVKYSIANGSLKLLVENGEPFEQVNNPKKI